MDPRLETHHKALQLNTRLLRNCLAGVDDALARRRPNEHTNNLAFLAMHLVDVRAYATRYLGGDLLSPFHEILEPIKKIDELETYPEVDALLAAWAASEAPLFERLGALTSTDLDGEAEPKFPLGATRLDGLTFLVEHESFHIGQMAILRRVHGLPAMSYA